MIARALGVVMLIFALIAPGGVLWAQDARVWENYDFVPGSKVIFFTDFSEDRTGNFPRGLKFTGGSMDVVELDGVKVLRALSRSQFQVPLGQPLPERFTLEVDLIAPPVATGGYDLLAFEGGADWDRSDKSAEINWTSTGMVILGGGQNVATSQYTYPESMIPQLRGEVVHLRMLMDGDYFKLYTNERRAYNLPELKFKRDAVIRFLLNGSEEPDMATYITSIRVAESDTDVLYDALAARGRWATQGILFETGKADLKPESTPVLKEIAATLKQHPDLSIVIEGHTDNVGTPATNLALSQARAEAVRAALVSIHGIDAGRIATQGLGDTTPTAPNTTSAGRAQNRRVEIVKR